MTGSWPRNIFSETGFQAGEVGFQGLGLEREAGASGFPLPGDFREHCGDRAEDGGFVWKEAGDTGAAFDPAVGVEAGTQRSLETFVGVGGEGVWDAAAAPAPGLAATRGLSYLDETSPVCIVR